MGWAQVAAATRVSEDYSTMYFFALQGGTERRRQLAGRWERNRGDLEAAARSAAFTGGQMARAGQGVARTAGGAGPRARQRLTR